MDPTMQWHRTGTHEHRCQPTARRATMCTPAWSANDATRSRQLPWAGAVINVAAYVSYESPRKTHENQIGLIDRSPATHHNVTTRHAIRAAAGIVARVAPRTALMIPTPLVSVEGPLARPRVAPLDGVPPFGREWTFRGTPGTRLGTRCAAILKTSCIDVEAPHRMCRWQSPPAARPVSAGVPAVAARAAGQHIEHAAGRAHDRRARHAACWSIGALGIIGWLIAAHEPFPGFAPAPAMQTVGVEPKHAVQSMGAVQTAAVAPATPTIAPAQPVAVRPVATPSTGAPVTRGATTNPAPRRADTTPNVQRVATAAPPTPHRSDNRRTATARVQAPSAPRFTARPSVTHHASRTQTPDRVGSPAHPGAPRDPLDDPLTLIAVANALQADRPAPAANAPVAGFDWTAQLSHRRLTDVPDTLTR
ncbi:MULTISPECIES: hypothetical protein [unclassified Burkholderia]|uniref:hypothetical protein n=1 Tax=unclassified Burkholderia TaxID=2613784 RepID=UPI001FC83A64|nr:MULTISPECIES: hypothetical protein [unclassified Burkholderia]